MLTLTLRSQGTEKVIMSQEQLSKNRIIIENDTKGSEPWTPFEFKLMPRRLCEGHRDKPFAPKQEQNFSSHEKRLLLC